VGGQKGVRPADTVGVVGPRRPGSGRARVASVTAWLEACGKGFVGPEGRRGPWEWQECRIMNACIYVRSYMHMVMYIMSCCRGFPGAWRGGASKEAGLAATEAGFPGGGAA
jgi:hypothetical protein